MIQFAIFNSNIGSGILCGGMPEPVTIWFNFWIAVAVLALHLRVRAAAITQDQSALKRRASQAAYGSFGGATVCILFGILYLCLGLPAWSWISVAIVLIISVAIPLLIQAKTGGLTGGGSKESGQRMDTVAYWLMYTSVAIIIVSFITLIILQQLAIL